MGHSVPEKHPSSPANESAGIRDAGGLQSDVSTTASPGIGRVAYVGLNFGLTILAVMLMLATPSEDVALLINLFAVVIGIYLVSSRFRNIGYQPLWAALALVPIINLIVGYRCLAYPPGYAVLKQLDTAGKIVTGIYAVFIGLLLISVFLAILEQ